MPRTEPERTADPELAEGSPDRQSTRRSDQQPGQPSAALPTPSGGPASRRAALRGLLGTNGLDALLITDLLNVRYLTGFTGSNAALLVGSGGDGDTLFCTDSRYDTQSAAEVPDLQRLIERPCDLALLAGASGRLGFEAHVVTVAGQRSLAGAAARTVELVPVSDLVEQGRAIKDAGEIQALSTACEIADRALHELIDAGGVTAGRTERAVALDLDERMRRLGAAPAFDTIVAAGPHSAIPHHQPTPATLRRGDLVKFDFGAEVGGYHSDMTRTFVLGPPADWQRDLYALVEQAQRAGRYAARPGITGGELDAAARSVIVAAGMADRFGHGLGHGVGLQIHEAPAVAPDSAVIIASDMCVTVEPGIYLPERGGVRIEDTGVITTVGYQVLTMTSKDLRVL